MSAPYKRFRTHVIGVRKGVSHNVGICCGKQIIFALRHILKLFRHHLEGTKVMSSPSYLSQPLPHAVVTPWGRYFICLLVYFEDEISRAERVNAG